MTRLLLLASAAVLAACSTLDLEPTAPAGFDLSGTWLINPVLSDAAPQRGRSQSDTEREGVRSARPPRRPSLLGLSFITQDFPVLAARRLRIEQNRDSMGMDFDRGTYRDVSWGERERGLWRVRAGWNEGDLVVVSDGEDARVEERFAMLDAGARLKVTVSYVFDGNRGEYRRVFDRFESARSERRLDQ